MSRKTSRNGNKKRRHRTRKQIYKMKGCSKQTGGYIKQGNLAFPSSNVPVVRNPNLAYTGVPNYSNAYPNRSIDDKVVNGKQYVSWLNTQTNASKGGGNRSRSSSSSSSSSRSSNKNQNQNGGSCGCGAAPLLQSGGNNGLPFGEGLPPMKGIPYAGGTAGEALVPGNIATWPGIKPVDSNGNYYDINSYKNGFTTNPLNESPVINIKGGKMRNKRNKSMKGGYNYSNSLMQDFTNLGRQFTYGLGSTYNALNGYQQGPNPLPWKSQLVGTPSYGALKLLKY